MSSMKPDTLSQPAGVASTYNISFTSVNRNSITTEELRQNIPTKKRSVDPHPQGLIIEGGVGYRQTVVIRSYEVGPDKTATLESILNLLQLRIKKNLIVQSSIFNHTCTKI
nr:palmitoyl-acyl carrier protein thioesterase, chloroplastic [Quercus suber]